MPLTSRSASTYVPEVGVSRQPSKFMSVDLPDPEGPMSATYSPRCMSRSMPLSTCTVWPPSLKSRVISRSSITESFITAN